MPAIQKHGASFANIAATSSVFTLVKTDLLISADSSSVASYSEDQVALKFSSITSSGYFIAIDKAAINVDYV